MKETFNWRWFYYCLTEEGIEYLREYLAIPSDIVPETVQKAQSKSAGANRFSYDDKNGKAGAPGGFRPNFERGDRPRRDGYRAGGRE